MRGLTTSEQYLSALADRAFFKLWTYPNVFIKKGGKAKELCDLLLVFGDDLVVFSDKDCALQQGSATLALSWGRWYRRAVISSAAQASGAARIIRRSDPLFLDAACQEPFPLTIPDGVRVHLVLTVQGASEAARSEWGGRGSLVVTNRPLGDCSAAPFRVGFSAQDGDSFHIFDRNALDAVLSTLDTAADFISYLRRREALLTRPHPITAASEEDLLGLYLASYDEENSTRDFPKVSQSFHVDGSHWERWRQSPERARWDKANEVSYVWDEIIEKVSGFAIEGALEHTSNRTLAEHEQMLRWMGRENRFSRRVLSQSLSDMYHSTPAGQIRRRSHETMVPEGPVWLFLIAHTPPDEEHARYRNVRRELLFQSALALRHVMPAALDIAAIATGKEPGGFSYDTLYFDCRDLDPEMAQMGKLMHEEQGVFSEVNRFEGIEYDY